MLASNSSRISLAAIVLIVASCLFAADPSTAESHASDIRALKLYYYDHGTISNQEMSDRLLDWVRSHPDDGEALFFLAGVKYAGDRMMKIAMLKRAADAHYDPALAFLGYYRILGKGIKADVQLGEQELNTALAHKCPDAYFLKAMLFLSGEGGYPQNKAKAAEYLKQACDLGDKKCLTMLALVYADLNEGAKAIEAAKESAKAGDPEAEAYLATWYMEGRITAENPQEAFKWMNRAALDAPTRGDYAFRVGDMCAVGYGVDHDDAKAFQWFERSAKLGNSQGQLRLASAYLTGTGIEKNLAQGTKLLTSAADSNCPEAQLLLGRALLEGKWMQKDVTAAKLWLLRAANAGNSEAAAEMKRIDATGE